MPVAHFRRTFNHDTKNNCSLGFIGVRSSMLGASPRKLLGTPWEAARLGRPWGGCQGCSASGGKTISCQVEPSPLSLCLCWVGGGVQVFGTRWNSGGNGRYVLGGLGFLSRLQEPASVIGFSIHRRDVIDASLPVSE